jgi:type II secretory pathway component PulF
MFSFRIGQRELSGLCRRLHTALEAGIDARKAWKREATGHGSVALRARLGQISEAIDKGWTVNDAIDQTGEYFPPLFREMVAVGEETGNLAEIFQHLAEHYDHQLKLRRNFLAAIAWPVIQLVAALGIIGLLIWIMGILPTGPGGERVDILGLGVGTRGLVVYLLLIGLIAGLGVGLYVAVQRGMFGTRALQRGLMNVPVIGASLQTLALSRLAWALHLTMETSLDLRRSLTLSLRSTHNARYTDDCEQIVNAVAGGDEIHEALARTGAYPTEFLDALEVGERSGRLPETMATLARQYQDQARRALAVLTAVAGFAVWAVVAILIIIMIFRIFTLFYLNPINEALEDIY